MNKFIAALATADKYLKELNKFFFNHTAFERRKPKYKTIKPKQRYAVKRVKKLHHRQKRGGK